MKSLMTTVSSVNEVIILLKRAVAAHPLSPVTAWNGGRVMDPWTFEAVEYCWWNLKRMGKTHGSKRCREWQKIVLQQKKIKVQREEEEEEKREYAEVLLSDEAQMKEEEATHAVDACIQISPGSEALP